jgi:nucleotide-binding universal stress UspA family protein
LTAWISFCFIGFKAASSRFHQSSSTEINTMHPFYPRKILCPVDMSELSDLALKYAHVGARVFNASLTVLHAMHVEYPRYLSRDLTDHVLAELNNAKASIVQRLANHVHKIIGDASDNQVTFDFKASDLPPAEAVMQATADTKADLVVMGTHGYNGFKHWILGSVTESVLHLSRIPVFTIRQKTNGFIDTAVPESLPVLGHILCPCNLTQSAEQALRVAVDLAEKFKAALTVLWSVKPGTPSPETQLREWVQHIVQSTRPVDIVVRRGSANTDAIDLAMEKNSDLIVIGAHHKPFGQGTIVGHTTERVLRTAPVPVFSVPFFKTDL